MPGGCVSVYTTVQQYVTRRTAAEQDRSVAAVVGNKDHRIHQCAGDSWTLRHHRSTTTVLQNRFKSTIGGSIFLSFLRLHHLFLRFHPSQGACAITLTSHIFQALRIHSRYVRVLHEISRARSISIKNPAPDTLTTLTRTAVTPSTIDTEGVAR